MTEPVPRSDPSCEVDGARILERARRLAFPRYPGTEGDRRMCEIVAREFREAGLEVERQEFSYDIRVAFRAIRIALTACAVLIASAGWIAVHSAPLALGLLAVGLIAGGALLVWTPMAEKLYERPGPTRTENIAGYRRVERPRLTLICMAHHDSKSQNLTFPVRMGLTLGAITGTLALTALLVAALSGRAVQPDWLPLVPALVAAGSMLALSTLSSGNASPGGVDNAGSLATVLELARLLPRQVVPDVELIFLSTGAEEDHMVGAMRWLDAHRESFEGRTVHTLNLDGAGSPGRAVILERYGVGHRFAPHLATVALQTADRMGIPLRRVWLPPAIGIDAIPFHHRGQACLTFSSGSLGRATIAVHSAGDVADNLDVDALERVGRLTFRVALSLASAQAADF